MIGARSAQKEGKDAQRRIVSRLCHANIPNIPHTDEVSMSVARAVKSMILHRFSLVESFPIESRRMRLLHVSRIDTFLDIT